MNACTMNVMNVTRLICFSMLLWKKKKTINEMNKWLSENKNINFDRIVSMYFKYTRKINISCSFYRMFDLLLFLQIHQLETRCQVTGYGFRFKSRLFFFFFFLMIFWFVKHMLLGQPCEKYYIYSNALMVNTCHDRVASTESRYSEIDEISLFNENEK